MEDCVFCKIASRDIPSDIVYEDDELVAFLDINPQAPVHQLVIPRRHISTTNDLTDNDLTLMGKLMLKASDLAANNPELADGYRLIFNCNKHGGQEVYHVHLHILGGRQMTWPPG